MTNPYEPPIDDRTRGTNAAPTHYHPLTDYLVGFRNGTLWSLILAIPTIFAIYGEYAIGRSLEFDPVTQTTTRVDLNTSDVWYCTFAAIFTTATAVTLPWAFVAGFVNLGRARKRRAKLNAS